MSHYYQSAYTTVSRSELEGLRRDHGRAVAAENNARSLQERNRRLEEARRAAEAESRAMAKKVESLSDAIRKTTTENSELRTQISQVVRRQDERLRQMSASHEAHVREIQSNFQSQLDSTRSSFAKEIGSVRADVASTIRQNNRAIERAIGETAAALQRDMSSMRNEIGADVAAVRQDVERIDASVANLSAKVTSIGAEVSSMQSGNAQLLSMAEEYRRMAQVVLKDVRANCPHYESLCSAELTHFNKANSQAKQDLELASNNPQNSVAAHLSAREAFVCAVTLRGTAFAMENEWQEHYQMAQQALVAAEEQLDSHKRVLVFDEQGYDPVYSDVDRWTFGHLTMLGSHIVGLKEQLQDARDINELDGTRDALAKTSEDVAQASEQAYISTRLSQQRADIAEDFAEIFRLKFLMTEREDGYFGNDERRGHRIRLKNPNTGLEVILTQEPGELGGEIGQRFIADVVNFGSTPAGDREDLQALINQYVNAVVAGNGLEYGASPVSRPASSQDSADCHARARMSDWFRGVPQGNDVPTADHVPGWRNATQTS